MSKQQTRHTEAFRRETVNLLESSGKSVAELAREMGIHEKSLYRWRKQYGSAVSGSENGTSGSSAAQLEAELKRLRRELEVVRQERDILKKAISIFSRSQP
jgi:transposase